MTTITTPPVPLAASRPGARPPRLTIGGVVRSEAIKLSSLRSVRLTLVLTLLAGLGLSALMALAMRDQVGGGGMLTPVGYLQMVSSFSAPFIALIFGVLGVFVMSSEYSSGMILSTLAAAPRRGLVFGAKALVLALVAAVTALLLVACGLAIAVASVPAAASALTDPAVITGGLGAVAYLTLIALFAFGVAGILRSTAGGITVVAGVTFVLPVAFQVLMFSGWEWVPVVAEYLPMSLGSMITAGAVPHEGTGPGYGMALLSMVIWAAATVIPAILLFRARDAK